MSFSIHIFTELLRATDVTYTLIPAALEKLNNPDTLDQIIQQVTIDSRDIYGPCIFFALKGDVADGHSFIKHAYYNGALICIGSLSFEQLVTNGWIDDHSEIHNQVYIQTEDPILFLQKIAQAYRETCIPNTFIIGVTGSVGKTTVKDILGSVFDTYAPVVTAGNLNNHIGVPLSILSISPKTRIAILEAGMNHRGETKLLAEIMQPDLIAITKIGVAHIEYLGSREEIAREKSDLALCSPRAKNLFIPSDDEYAQFISTYVAGIRTDIQVHLTGNGASLPIPSTTYIPQSQLSNFALVTDIISYTLDTHMIRDTAQQDVLTTAEICKKILNAHISPRRFEIKRIPNRSDVIIIDDSYNANPDSMKAGLQALNDIDPTQLFAQDSLIAPQKIAILGGMAELGEQSDAMHQDITAFLHTLPNIDIAFSVGELAKKYNFEHQLLHKESIKDALQYLIEYIHANARPTIIFIKGSKSTHMSDLADSLLEHIQNSIK